MNIKRIFTCISVYQFIYQSIPLTAVKLPQETVQITQNISLLSIQAKGWWRINTQIM